MKIDSTLFAHRLADSSNKFHRAAIDGYVDMLCEASRRDTNQAEPENGLTPTLLAARSGQLEALRILVGRGGDPERCTCDGSNSLHLAALGGHLNCVSFLVNFGVNMWALDNRLHTAKDVAAIEQKKDVSRVAFEHSVNQSLDLTSSSRQVLDYLDQMMAKQSALNTKSVQKLKEKAKVATEKRMKELRKAQLKAIKQVEKDERYLAKLSNNRRLLKAAHSISDIKLIGRSAPISFSPSERSSSGFASDRPSPSLSSLMSSKLQLDLAQSQAIRSRQLNFRSIHHLGSASSDYESACLSSVSSSSSSSQQQSNKSRAMRPKYSDLVALSCEPISRSAKSTQVEQQSVKSNSTIGTRLRAISSGVPRKVQLKRLLLNTSSPTDQQLESRCRPESNQDLVVDELEEPNQDPKLCNVQPAIKLKLNSTNQPQCDPDISWPPAPTLTRTVSEPDFSASLRVDQEQLEDSNIADESTGCSSAAQNEDESPNESQHHLLTKCLSQLKLRHEAITMQNNQNVNSSCNKQPAQPKPASGVGGRKQTTIFANSDELLQHQLNASEFPLRPSIIKQHLNGQQVATKATEFTYLPAKSNNTTSADSIGSASSLVNTNSQSSSSSPSRYSCSSSTCSSIRPNQQPVQQSANQSTPDAMMENLRQRSSCTQTRETIETFLHSNNLLELSDTFEREQIDLDALMLISEEDLKSINVLLGPRRKLLKAIDERRKHLMMTNNKQPNDSSALYVMVDTPL